MGVTPRGRRGRRGWGSCAFNLRMRITIRDRWIHRGLIKPRTHSRGEQENFLSERFRERQSDSLPAMIRRLLLVLCLACAALGASLDTQWHSWKAQHSKTYSDQEEEDARRLVWYDNFKKIIEHNNANKSYTLALNEFADLVCCYRYQSFFILSIIYLSTQIAAVSCKL